jgi:hypothetical protein
MRGEERATDKTFLPPWSLAMAFLKMVLGLSIIVGGFAPAIAQDAPQTAKMNALLVYGKDFMFGVTEPDGWVGDTSDKATRRLVNIVFFPKDKTSKANKVKIRIRVNSKVDENTLEVLNADTAGLRKKFSKLELEDLTVEHAGWKTYAKLLFVPGSIYEYVAYLNPGPDSRLMFSVALSKTGSRASDAELKAFAEILESIRLLSSPGFKVIK